MFNLQEMEARLAEIDRERAILVPLIEAARAYEGVRGKVVHERGNIVMRERPVSPSSSSTPAPASSSASASASASAAAAPADGLAIRVSPRMRETEAIVLEWADQTNTPISTAKVIALMREKGLEVPNRPNNVISARLSNSKRVEGRRGLGWWPAGRPWPDE